MVLMRTGKQWHIRMLHRSFLNDILSPGTACILHLELLMNWQHGHICHISILCLKGLSFEYLMVLC